MEKSLEKFFEVLWDDHVKAEMAAKFWNFEFACELINEVLIY